MFFTKYSAASPPSSLDDKYNQTTMPQTQPPMTPEIIPEIWINRLHVTSPKVTIKKFDRKLLIICAFVIPLAVALAQMIEKAIGTTDEAIRIPVK